VQKEACCYGESKRGRRSVVQVSVSVCASEGSRGDMGLEGWWALWKGGGAPAAHVTELQVHSEVLESVLLRWRSVQ
jgi:hypothetical protein